MELIIKTTSKCNMCCKFCAASNIDVKPVKKLPQKIIETIDLLKPEGLILTGGDSLCQTPEFYKDILERYPDKKIDMVTNLKAFYENPNEWIDIFKNPNVYVCTSFNYGSTRMWDKDTVYSEQKFREVMNLFKEKVGYMPIFIAVIDKDNFKDALRHIELAKELGAICRLNNAMKLGRQGEYFPRYNVFKLWLQIVKNGDEQYETNCIERFNGQCPINSNHLCESTIRAIYLNSNNEVKYNTCEDKLNEGFSIEVDKTRPEVTKSKTKIEECINPQRCSYCELFNICNGCRTNREQAKKYSPEYCQEMLKIKNDIIEAGWKL